MAKKTLVWFRQDLRLSDNPGLFEAANQGDVLAVYIFDEPQKDFKLGAASRWWLHHSLNALNKQLDNKLNIYSGNAEAIIAHLIKEHRIDAIHWNRCYEPWRIAQDSAIKLTYKESTINCMSFNGSLLWEPWEVLKDDGTPYKVFTPFYKRCVANQSWREPLPCPKTLNLIKDSANNISVDDLDLLPKIHWDLSLKKHWVIGEAGAQVRLSEFIDEGLQHYKEGRDFPAQNSVSRLSPHLHFGEISPNQVALAITAQQSNQAIPSQEIEHFLRELGWREFSYSMLYHYPELPWKNFQEKFDKFPWQTDEVYLKAWQTGKTGFPIIDAGMRELWQTGYMHNRVRMIVGSFLVKNLLQHWHHGEKWFWDCLVDADLANNSASWQWVAGSGADASPYFRIFNPVLQGQKFDPNGDYTKQYVPELKALPSAYLHQPWDAPESLLKQAGIILGETYPHPIVDLKASRIRALEALSETN